MKNSNNENTMNIKTALFYTLFSGLIFLNIYQCHRNSTSPLLGTYSDTLTVYDTVKYTKLIPRDSLVLNHITVKLPPAVSDSTCTTETLNICKLKDSVQVQIPISQKIYETDTYTAYVSGYATTIDSLVLKMPTHFVENNTPPKKHKDKKWSVGIQVGYGVTVNNTPKFCPYIGVGISYKLFSF